MSDDNGLMYREVRIDDDGTLVIAGHDVNSGIEGPYSEYEFTRSVAGPDVPQLLQSLDAASDADPLAVLRERFSSTAEIEEHLEAHGVPSRFSNWIGD